MSATAQDLETIRAAMPEPTYTERLEDAVAAYFSGQYPVGSCDNWVEAEQRLAEAAQRALERSPT